MANPAAQTALGPMLVVAVEQNFPPGQRLIHDKVIYRFLPPVIKAFVKLARFSPLRALLIWGSEKRGPGIWAMVLCRKRYIEDQLVAALPSGIGVVVNLGAGLDTLAYRTPELAAVPVFEVDLPENNAYKERLLQQVFGQRPAHVTLAPMDFDRQDLAQVLPAHGYPAGAKAFFIWEGVTQYLAEQGVRKTFDFLASAVPGSRLVFTYIRQDFMDGTNTYGAKALYQGFRVKEQVWRFGIAPEEVSNLLADYGWRELEQAGSQEFMAQYLEPAGRAQPVSEIERIVYAEKM